VEEPIQEDLVIIVHGIRTRARWQAEIRGTLEESGFLVELTNYGPMTAIQFLLPTNFFRRKAIATVWTQVRLAKAQHPNARVSIIAHSFGTYVISQIIKDDFEIRFHKLVFCGSVVKHDFPFEQFRDRITNRIVNEVATNDPWPALAECWSGYGSTGTYGFRNAAVRDRFHSNAGHGYFLSRKFCKEYWVPYFNNSSIASFPNTEENLPKWWIRFISSRTVKYVLFLILIVAMIRPFFLHPFFNHSTSSDGSFYPWDDMVPTIIDEASQECPLDFAFGENCTSSLGSKITQFFIGRRYLQVQEFDGDTLRQIVGCRPYSYYGRDPVEAIDVLGAQFKECVSISHSDSSGRMIIRAKVNSMEMVTSRTGSYYLCECNGVQIGEFRRLNR